MNSYIDRQIIKTEEISTSIDFVLKANIAFSLWSRPSVDCHDALIQNLKDAGFHVILVKNISSLRDGDGVYTFEHDAFNAFEFVSEFNKAKLTGHKVALIFYAIHRYIDEAAQIFGRVVFDKADASYKKHAPLTISFDENDVLFATGCLDENDNIKHSLHDAVMSRMMNRKLEEIVV